MEGKYASPEIAKAYKKTEGWKEIQAKKIVNPYNILLPSTFHYSPEIVKVIKKRDQWDDINAMANNEFEASIAKTIGSLPPSDASLASYLQKRKKQGKVYPLQMISICKPVINSVNPSQDFDLKTKKPLLTLWMGPWPFGDLSEKVCSLASYCRKRKQQELPLTPAQERSFQHLVDLHQGDLNEGPAIRCFNF